MLTSLQFAERILMLANRVPFSVGSWGRTPRRNRSVEGLDHSYHLIWLAVVIHLDSVVDFPLLYFLCRSMGFDCVKEGDHVHIEPGPSLGYGA